jgi:hypothetical protein
MASFHSCNYLGRCGDLSLAVKTSNTLFALIKLFYELFNFWRIPGNKHGRNCIMIDHTSFKLSEYSMVETNSVIKPH